MKVEEAAQNASQKSKRCGKRIAKTNATLKGKCGIRMQLLLLPKRKQQVSQKVQVTGRNDDTQKVKDRLPGSFP